MTLSSNTIDERISGAAMDQPAPRRARQRIAVMISVFVPMLALAMAAWRYMPRGLYVPMANLRIATVERGMFRDEAAMRATAAPLHSVMIDAVESGRVEEVFVHDGALVKQGELLFRLSNPQRHLDLLARESDRAQQIANLSNLRVALEASQSEHRRRMSDLSFALRQAQRQHERNEALAQKGFISAAALDESADRLTLQRRAYSDEQDGGETEIAIKRDAVRQMEGAIARLDAGLRLINGTIEALAVRAPADGRLTDFRLQVGEAVKADQHIGRIDDPDRFKLSAQVDEYYLDRIRAGLRGDAVINGRSYPVEVSRIFPQIREGRFTMELTFDGEQPATLNPGQSMEVHIVLGDAKAGLLLPNDAFVNDTGGGWAFVVNHDGTGAERRAIRIGRRNNNQLEVLSGLAEGDRVIVSSYAAYGQAERLQFDR